MTPEQIAEYRTKQGSGYTSAVGEYTPSAFWDALDTIEGERAEITRLQSALAAEQARHKETEDIATGALHAALESLAAQQALVVELADALQEFEKVDAMPGPHGMMPVALRDFRSMARAALAKVGR